MRYLRKYKLFFEDGDGGGSAGSGDASCSVGGNAYVNATTAGMGDITNAVVGDLPGVSGASGSGDVTVVSKRSKRKKGNPTQVTDLRDLDDVKTNKIEEFTNISGDEINEYDLNVIKDSFIDLTDMGFNIDRIYKCKIDSADRIDIILVIDSQKMVSNIKFDFDRIRIYHGSESPELKSIYDEKLNEYDEKILNISKDSCHSLINMLDYDSGKCYINYSYTATTRLIRIQLFKYVKMNKIEESIIIGGDEIDEYDLNIIKDSMIELNDLGFKIIKIYKNGLTDTEKIFITLELNTTKMNRGIILHYFFNKDNVMDKSEKRLGKIGQKKVEYNPNEFERKVVNTIEYISHQLINMLDYYDAIIDIYHEKNSFNNFKIEIELFGESKKINPLKESYYSKQDYFQEIQSGLENYNIRPVALNNLLDMYENDILKNWEDGVTPNVFVCQIVKELELETGEFMNVNKSIGNPQTTIKYL